MEVAPSETLPPRKWKRAANLFTRGTKLSGFEMTKLTRVLPFVNIVKESMVSACCCCEGIVNCFYFGCEHLDLIMLSKIEFMSSCRVSVNSKSRLQGQN
jgi:hypothetical protein